MDLLGSGIGQRSGGRARVGALGIYAVMIGFALLLAGPFIWVVLMSLKNEVQAAAWPPVWIPSPPAWSNFPTALLRWVNFPQMLLNTVLIAAAAVVGDVLCGSFVAYGFARYRFPGRDLLFAVLLSTMMVPMAVRLVPLFLI